MYRMVFLVSLLLLSGCGESAKPGRGVPVSGKITLGGKPLADADVLFTNDGKKSGCYVRLVYGDEFGINSNIPKNNQQFLEKPYNPDQDDENMDEQESNKKGRKRH